MVIFFLWGSNSLFIFIVLIFEGFSPYFHLLRIKASKGWILKKNSSAIASLFWEKISLHEQDEIKFNYSIFYAQPADIAHIWLFL